MWLLWPMLTKKISFYLFCFASWLEPLLTRDFSYFPRFIFSEFWNGSLHWNWHSCLNMRGDDGLSDVPQVETKWNFVHFRSLTLFTGNSHCLNYVWILKPINDSGEQFDLADLLEFVSLEFRQDLGLGQQIIFKFLHRNTDRV